jgi:hypothetical protein
LIGSNIVNRKTGLFSGVIYSIFSTLPQIEGFTANAEVFSLLPATMTIWLLLKKRPGWAGITASLAFIIKPSGISAVIFAVIWLFCSKSNIRDWSKFILGIIPLPLLCLLQGVSTVGISRYLYAIAGMRMDILNNTVINYPYPNIITGWRATSLSWFPLSLLSAYGLIRREKKLIFLILAWLATSITGITLGGLWFAHYFIQLIPPLSFSAAIGGMKVFRSNTRLIKYISGLILIPSIFYLLIFSIIPPKIGSIIIYHRQGFIIAEDVADYIQRYSGEDDEIYISVASANINYLAHRLSSIPDIFWANLVYRPGEFHRLLESVSNKEPKYVLYIESPPPEIDPHNEFLHILNENYYIETYFDRIPLYRRIE